MIIDKDKEALDSPRGKLAALLLSRMVGSEVYVMYKPYEKAAWAIRHAEALIAELQRSES